MGLLDLFKKKRSLPAVREEIHEDFSTRLLADFARHDYLGKAALAGEKARSAKKQGDFNAAWGFYQEVKEHYIQHAARQKFTAAQTLALDATVSQQLADILRLEGKHHDALVHIIYWVACTHKPSKSQEQKLRAYFNRCKFRSVTLTSLESYVSISRSKPDFTRIRDTVSEWRVAD